MSGRYLLDTNIIIALFADEVAVKENLAKAEEVFASSMAIGELCFGARKSGRVYLRVWSQLPIANFFLNSIIVASVTVVLNLLFTSLAAYPFAKMNLRGRNVIFYLLLATFIVPPQLASIPSFVLAVNVFHFHDTILALIFPSLATVFNTFVNQWNDFSGPR